MKKEHTIERQGKTIILYPGLLNAAHEKGLHSIRTELYQVPKEENNYVAIVFATVTFRSPGKGAGEDRIFTGIGDASSKNVSAAIATALIRMAETRAKARAMRDGCNIDLSLEDDDERREEEPVRTVSPQQNNDSAPGGDRNLMNTSGASCPECHAPDGKNHTPRCKQV